MTERFCVDAGKYENDGEENCKYSDEFPTLHEAMQALEKVNDYPWSRIVYFGPDAPVGYQLDFHPLFNKLEGKDLFVRI